MRKELTIAAIAAVMLAGMAFNREMDKAFPKATLLADNLNMISSSDTSMDRAYPSSNWWEVRALQSALGNFFGGRVGAWFAGLGAATKFTKTQ